MKVTKKYPDELTYKVIGCAIEVHKRLGPGLIESVYERCFLKELELRKINYKNQVLAIKLQRPGIGYRIKA